MTTAWLRYQYNTDLRGNQVSPDDYIGPFPTAGKAAAHQYKWGPINAEIVHEVAEGTAPENVVSPEDHIAHMKRRYDL